MGAADRPPPLLSHGLPASGGGRGSGEHGGDCGYLRFGERRGLGELALEPVGQMIGLGLLLKSGDSLCVLGPEADLNGKRTAGARQTGCVAYTVPIPYAGASASSPAFLILTMRN